MSRYSRSVIPGRNGGEENNDSLDRVIFGSKKKPEDAANEEEPDFLPPVEDEEAIHLVERSNEDRRKSDRRTANSNRRGKSTRRMADYKPLREEGRRGGDDGKRGPLLLVGALLIVGVFSFVVWNAYREGVRTDGGDAAPPQLATAGAFKTPPRVIADAPIATTPAASAEVLEQLEGGPAKTPEVRPDPAPAKPAAPVQTATAPPPSTVTATPPAPLKTPVVAPPGAKPTPPPAPTQEVKAAVAITTPAPAATPAAAPAPAVAASGTWLAQIAAATSEAGAIAEWNRLSKANPDLLSTAQRFVVQADVNGRTVYRLRAGPFASKADADAFCTAFKAKGGNCFPAAK